MNGLLKIRLCRKIGSNPLKEEAIAARLAFSLAAEMNGGEILIEGDSLFLIDQILITDWCIDGEVTTIRKLLVDHVEWKVAWISREENYMAHYLAKWGLESNRCGDINVGDVPLNRCGDINVGDVPLNIVHCDDCSFEE
ncbi:hypothetical protein CJ030_MR2G009974 [Morella rubra]|uniref:RNase H type-1 domain-containing protein n=1 Tax=Morella rubra TaxID=262757 RepID=A0A6A1WL88_9ROSI|nr:hypothetical protein CJ030_MR2G009974 [Morella rubra]